jgi:hypothetical protein
MKMVTFYKFSGCPAGMDGPLAVQAEIAGSISRVRNARARFYSFQAIISSHQIIVGCDIVEMGSTKIIS